MEKNCGEEPARDAYIGRVATMDGPDSILPYLTYLSILTHLAHCGILVEFEVSRELLNLQNLFRNNIQHICVPPTDLFLGTN